MLGKIAGKRRRRWQRMRWLDNTTNSMDMNLSKPQEIVEDRGPWLQSTRPQRVRHSLVTTTVALRWVEGGQALVLRN